jgi:anti-sigma regulatory factor (Ser/Thr protein kinase)
VTGVDSERASGFRHEAVLYQDLREYRSAVVPFVQEGLASSQPVLVVVPGAADQIVRASLNGQAADVTFADMALVGRNPGRIVSAIWEFMMRHAGRRVRIVGEPIWPGRSAAEITEAMTSEAMLNLALASSEVAMLCPYDVSRLAPGVADCVGLTHPMVRSAGRSEPSAEFETGYLPRAAARPLTPPPASAERFPYTRDLRAVRDVVAAHAERAGLDEDRTADLVLAVGEVAANTVRHAPGDGLLQIWQAGTESTDTRLPGAELICQITDAGQITDPLAGRRSPAETGGLGLWVVHQLCDLVELRTGERGTTVRMHMALPSR